MPQVTPIAHQIWDMKYRLKEAGGAPVDETLEDTWRRVARGLAAAESEYGGEASLWETAFYDTLRDFKFLPAGRILAGTGAGRDVTLFNCFVMGTIPDSIDGIFAHLREAALTMQQGGGIGYDFSTLRPTGASVAGVGADASGPLSFMAVWDAMCRTIVSAGYRRGAMMGTLRCDHPDIEAFIDAKREPGQLRMFNMSVLVTDAFMEAVKSDGALDLVFAGTTYATVRARELWQRIMRSTYDYAEPGVIFIDRINRLNNLHYAETITATNPCGEQPLPPYGACLLGSVNLAKLVKRPFDRKAELDLRTLAKLVPVAVRMLDDAIDISRFPLEAQRHEARAKRRIGLGVTGLADALIMCGARYGSERAVALVERWMKTITRAAYLASAELAREKGSFPLYDREPYLASPFVSTLDQDVREAIAANGIRNALLTSIAPTGTISILADNVSSGIEPVYAHHHRRNVLMPDGNRKTEEVSDYAYALFRQKKGGDASLPEAFVDVQSLDPDDHLAIHAAAQKYIDSSISKTINCPPDISFEDFQDVYMKAYELGCKGCTTYRPNPVTGAVLETEAGAATVAVGSAGEETSEDGVVYISEPLSRPAELPGKTYKIRWPDSDHAIYITVNDVIRDGRRRPFEVFINSKNMEHYAWTVALTRMISAVFRRGGDVAFVVEELKAVFDPRGGQWVSGRYVPSLLAAIGDVIEAHMVDIGFLPPRKPAPEDREGRGRARRVRACPKCGAAALVRQEGCDLCRECGYSNCG
ncbi:MAG: adenosylcobalamin-dependent ribonucleoside-diphosphate reductase [Alphaproteobacteria bacterium]